ncbi:MAG: NUDIX hydrolase [Phycisphaerae bacterium]|nr:NUDIX hydrolase [Phycisphaerae bacterium]
MTTLLSTKLFSVERRIYRRSSGVDESVTREVIVHPGAVVILPVLDDGRIVMIRNHRFAVEQELVELPAGTREPGEPPETTARRELREETGYEAARIEPLASFFTSPGILTERMHGYLATGLRHVGQALEDTEQIRVDIMDALRVRHMVETGEIIDGKSLTMLGIYFLRQGSGKGCAD